MKRNVLFLCLIGLISLAACAAPTPDQPLPTVEAPTATVITETPSPSETTQPTTTPTPTEDLSYPAHVVAPDQVWLASDSLMIYSHSGNLCIKDGNADPVYLMPAESCHYYHRLYNDNQTIILLSKEGSPTYQCAINPSYSYGTRIWSVDRQTGIVNYLTSTYDIAEQLGLDSLPPVSLFKNVPGSNTYVFNTAEDPFGGRYNRDLYLVDEKGQLTILREPGDGAFKFYLSPDGQHIAYVSRDNEEPDSPGWIGLIDINGENLRTHLITYNWIASLPFRPDIMPLPVWKEDSTGFWIAIPPPNQQDMPNIMTTWYVPVSGEPLQLGSFERPLAIINDAEFSPDGKYVAYVSDHWPGLHIMQPDGSDDIVYFAAVESHFEQWEDNTHFIFRVWDYNDYVTEIYRGAIGEEPILLEQYAFGEDPDTIPVPAEGCEP